MDPVRRNRVQVTLISFLGLQPLTWQCQESSSLDTICNNLLSVHNWRHSWQFSITKCFIVFKIYIRNLLLDWLLVFLLFYSQILEWNPLVNELSKKCEWIIQKISLRKALPRFPFLNRNFEIFLTITDKTSFHQNRLSFNMPKCVCDIKIKSSSNRLRAKFERRKGKEKMRSQDYGIVNYFWHDVICQVKFY